jgi:hypothetical protein
MPEPRAQDRIEDAPSFELGYESEERLTVRVHQRSHPGAGDYWDGNWVEAQVVIRAGDFSGDIRGSLRTEEIRRFRDEVVAFYSSLRGEARFETMEKWLKVVLTSDNLGHVTAICEARDRPGMGNTLRFELLIDQTFLPPTIAGLDSIVERFPVIGSP